MFIFDARSGVNKGILNEFRYNLDLIDFVNIISKTEVRIIPLIKFGDQFGHLDERDH
jgi:hypothetical protein